LRRVLLALVTILVVALALPVAAAADPITITVNGVPVAMPLPPQLVGGTTLAPVRAIAQAMGAQVTWDAATQTVAITTPAAAMDVPAVFNAVRPSIVGIVALHHDASGNLAGVDTGSGVVIGPGGLVVTNAHVIGGADTVYVVVGPGNAAQVPPGAIWQDAVSDLAFLRTGLANLPAATLGDSEPWRSASR
jgi:S1-C subfamily serine protease